MEPPPPKKARAAGEWSALATIAGMEGADGRDFEGLRDETEPMILARLASLGVTLTDCDVSAVERFAATAPHGGPPGDVKKFASSSWWLVDEMMSDLSVAIRAAAGLPPGDELFYAIVWRYVQTKPLAAHLQCLIDHGYFVLLVRDGTLEVDADAANAVNLGEAAKALWYFYGSSYRRAPHWHQVNSRVVASHTGRAPFIVGRIADRRPFTLIVGDEGSPSVDIRGWHTIAIIGKHHHALANALADKVAANHFATLVRADWVGLAERDDDACYGHDEDVLAIVRCALGLGREF